MENPFSDRIVPDPETRPPVSVVSYNVEHLDTLVNRVLDGVKQGRNHTRASVVVSANPGSGKTHLLSRFIDAVSGSALPVFVPPINDSASLGRAVLNRLVARLWRTVESGRRINRFEWLTLQLIGLACADQPALSRDWREFPVEDLREPYFQDWLARERAPLEEYLRRRLDDLPVRPLHEAGATWSRALIDLLSGDPAVEAHAVDWIKGRMRRFPGGPGEESRIEDPEDEAAQAEQRLYDVTQFFGLCRPIVFVFDQVENFRSFGSEALRSLFVLIERLLVQCSSTQIVVAVNAADWDEFRSASGLPESYRDRFDRPQVLRGLSEAEARELRDLRAGPERLEAARQQIPDHAIRDWLMIGRDGRPGREVTPREFLRKCSEAWEGAVLKEEPPADELARELRKTRALVERESLGFFSDSIRTFLVEMLGARPVTRNRYELFTLGDCAIFFEDGIHWRRWEAWAQRARTLGKPVVRALRPGRELCALQHQQYGPVPAPRWAATRSLHRLLEEGLRIIEIDRETMLELLAACRLLDAAADLGRSRQEVADWFRSSHGARWRDFFPAPAAAKSKPAGAIFEKSTAAPAEGVRSGGVVMLSVGRLMELLSRRNGQLPVADALPIRERGLIFHDLACRFVRHLIEEGRVEIDPTAALRAFLEREPSWLEAREYDQTEPRATDALAAFAARIKRLRDSAGPLRSWQELYLSTELQVNQSLGVYEGVSILLTGRCDVLRRRRVGGPTEIVDYKLTGTGEHAVEKQIQLALYARLLARGAQPLKCDGVLEIYTPALTEARFSHEQLQVFFESEIEPALRRMARAALGKSPGVARIELRTTGRIARTALPLPADAVGLRVEQAFEGFIGNQEVVGRLKTALAAAAMDGQPPVLSKNILLTGAGGTGKSELARRVARATDQPLIEVPASRVGSVDELLALIDAELDDGSGAPRQEGSESGLPRFVYPPVVVFIDEVHEWRRKADKFLGLFEPRERRAVGSEKIADLRHATLIAATTDAGRLPRPFLTRFHQFTLRPYEDHEIAQILHLANVPGDERFRIGLARMARLNPRIAKLQSEEFIMHHRVHQIPVDQAGLDQLAATLGLDRHGLAARDWKYLAALQHGPVGIKIIANLLGLDEPEIARDIEPYLTQLGLVTARRSGRALTESGARLLAEQSR